MAFTRYHLLLSGAVLAALLGAYDASAISPQPLPVSIVVGESISTYGANANLRATVTSEGSALAHVPIRFTFASSTIAPINATTDASGNAKAAVAVPDAIAVGHYAIHVTFAGDSRHRAASGTGDLSILKAATIIGGAWVTSSVPANDLNATEWYENVSGSLTRRTDGRGIAGRTLSVNLDDQLLTTLPTGANGNFGFQVALRKPAGTYHVGVTFAGDDKYAPTTTSAPVLVLGPKRTIYFTDPQLTVAKLETGQDAVIWTKFTTGPNGTGQPVVGVAPLLCAPILGGSGGIVQYGGCDTVTSAANGIASKHYTLQVSGNVKIFVDGTPDFRYYMFGNSTNANIAPAPTKVFALIPSTVASPGTLTVNANALVLQTGKAPPCFGIAMYLESPGYGWGNPVAFGDTCTGNPIQLTTQLLDGWNPGKWKLKLSLENNAGFAYSEAIYNLTVVAKPTVKP